MDQYIGKVMGNRYEILERIGSGGMAVVYKARCRWLNRFVAIKILKEDLTQDEEFRRRFYDEAKAVAMLSHSNIVSIYDVSRSEDSSEPDYIVMELIDGITLKQYIQKRGGKLNWKEALHFITQIMKGLSHAHGRGIIHRDIKPHNIMILRDGSVKVADFGIARLVSSVQSTMTQEALGSVHYISPEQARGSHIDARSDIYSAGVVLYEMLTGRLPYEGDSPVAVAIQHINSIPLSPRELDDSIPEAMEEITMKAMASDVERRYASAEAMLVDLEELRKNPSISFDYSESDLLAGEGDEPTRPIGAAKATQVVVARPAHAAKQEEKVLKHSEPGYDDDEGYENEGGGFVRGLVIFSSVIACLAGVIYFLWITVFSGMVEKPQTFEVPDLFGYTLEEAAVLPIVVDQGFTIREGDYLEDDEVPAGQIISQSPEAKEMVKAGGQEITVTISLGGSGLQVPDLYNKDQRVAVNALNDLGLVPEIKEAYSDDVTKGNVMLQEPAANEKVEEGTVVTITVSQGREPKPHTMITVINMTLEEATDALKKLGLSIGSVQRLPNDEIEAGKITDQSVAPNTVVMEGTAIDLIVSLGPEAPVIGSTEPTLGPTTEPTPAPGKTSRKNGTVELPNDKETVTVRVNVGGEEKYRQEVPTRLRTTTFTVTGSGQQEIVVYIDDQEVKRYMEDFDS